MKTPGDDLENPGPAPHRDAPGRQGRDDTLRLYLLCGHNDLASSSAVALTLRAVGGLTTRPIALAYLAPERPMAQRIRRQAHGRSARRRSPGDVGTVMRVLDLASPRAFPETAVPEPSIWRPRRSG